MEKNNIDKIETKKIEVKKIEIAKFDKIEICKLELPDIERKQIWDPRVELIHEAYDKIVIIWNKDQKSRNFIKHLIACFLPIDQWSRAFNLNPEEENKCAILGVKLAGMKQISEGLADMGMKKMMIDCHLIGEERKKYTEEELKEIEAIKAKYPDEIQYAQVAYLSDKSDKKLSQEAVLALLNFTQNTILICDELNFTLKKMQLKRAQFDTETKLTDKQVNKIAKAAAFNVRDNIDDKTIDALQKLKLELEQNENGK